MQVRKLFFLSHCPVPNKIWNKLLKPVEQAVWVLVGLLNWTLLYYFLNVTEGSARKGRTKKEANENTNRHNPAGHERKIVEKLQNSEKKVKEWILRYNKVNVCL